MGVKSAVCDDRWINRGGGGRPSGRLQVSALPDRSAPRWEPCTDSGSGRLSGAQHGMCEVETLGEEMWGVEGCLGDAGLRSEETSGLEVYMAEYQRPRACGHGCGRAWVEP